MEKNSRKATGQKTNRKEDTNAGGELTTDGGSGFKGCAADRGSPKKALIAYLNDRTTKAVPEKHGKMSFKDLMGKDQGANAMDINNGNIRDFDRVARKYNIDYAVKKDKSESPPRYVVFFKGRDRDVIAAAFDEFISVNEKKSKRPSVREKLHMHISIAKKIS